MANFMLPAPECLPEPIHIALKKSDNELTKNVVFKPKNMTAEELQNGFLEISSNFNTLSNLIRRDFNSLKLGFYPFLATIGRNLESYLNRPRKLYSINSKVKY